MFITLLGATFLVALAVSFVVERTFRGPIEGILRRLIADEISGAWSQYMKFAIYVVGLSRGVRVWELERYVSPRPPRLPVPRAAGEAPLPELNLERWILEIYRTIAESLQGLAWALLAFFVFALVAYVIVRIFEGRRPQRN